MIQKIYSQQMGVNQSLFSEGVRHEQSEFQTNITREQGIFSREIDMSIYPKALELTYNDISNITFDPYSVSDWNTFFDLPTYGNPFTSVNVVGNTVKLYGGSNIRLRPLMFYYNNNLIKINDSANCVIEIGGITFRGASLLTSVILPAVTFVELWAFTGNNKLKNIRLNSLLSTNHSCFRLLPVLENLYIPKCTILGPTTGNNSVFDYNTGLKLTLTIPASLMTCNGGHPDGDIAYLVANNNVTIIQV